MKPTRRNFVLGALTAPLAWLLGRGAPAPTVEPDPVEQPEPVQWRCVCVRYECGSADPGEVTVWIDGDKVKSVCLSGAFDRGFV